MMGSKEKDGLQGVGGYPHLQGYFGVKNYDINKSMHQVATDGMENSSQEKIWMNARGRERKGITNGKQQVAG